ncbi:hypothetical protein LINGRAHAP2_LOCUS5442 [Linum grandiflorum]
MVDETTHHSSPTTTIVSSWPPVGSPHVPVDSAAYQEAEHLGHFDNSVNAVSFGFVATAILISMFLVMAIFERFLRPGNPSSRDSRNHVDVELGKFRYPSPKMTVYANGVSVLMPGDTIPTFIAHPVPVPVVAAPISDSPRPPPSPPPREGAV